MSTRNTCFGEYAIDYVRLYKSVRSERTEEMYENILKNHIWPIEKIKLKDITKDDVQHTINAIGNYPRICEQTYSLIRQVLSNAAENGLIKGSPCSHIVLPRYFRGEKRALSEYEKQAIRQAVLPPLEKAFIYTLYGTGVRPSELFALKLSDIDFKHSELYIRRSLHFKSGHPVDVGAPKTNSSVRSIPLPAFVAEALRLFANGLSENDYIFNDNGCFRSYSGYRNIFDSAMKQIFGIKGKYKGGITPYTFRHNYCTECRIRGVRIETCQKLMGHTTSRMVLDVYSHAGNDEEMKQFAKGFVL